MHVLAINSGSSSLKLGLYRVQRGEVQSLWADAAGSLAGLARRLLDAGLPPPQAIGHRIVHGGPRLRRHCRIDDGVLAQLRAATPFAPLHGPAALAAIMAAQAQFPGLPQVACFDTAFHATLPEVARTLPLPHALRDQGLQRYGFHGLSCESIVHQLAGALPQRLLIAHLGNGASISALQDGISIDTSMGMTPAGGIVMGTRSGDLDPGTLVWLMREKKLDADALEDLLERRSGLAGISGISGDMRRLHAAAATNADARLAIEMFCTSAAKQIAAMSTVLGGIDLLVFSGGIGENDETVRNAICSRLVGIGLTKRQVRVLRSQEDEQIARHTCALVAQGSEPLSPPAQ